MAIWQYISINLGKVIFVHLNCASLVDSQYFTMQKVERRQQIDDAIHAFVAATGETGTTDRAFNRLLDDDFDPELTHRVSLFVPIAFGRILLDQLGVQFSPEFTRIVSGGKLLAGNRLMRQPEFARAAVLGHAFLEGRYLDAFKTIALSSAEANAINNVLHAGQDVRKAKGKPPLIPDFDISERDFQIAVDKMMSELGSGKPQAKKPWWQLW